MYLERITHEIIGAGISVHRELGPGLLESTYEACLHLEIERRGLRVERQKAMRLVYRGELIECAFRADLVIEDDVIAEIKAIDRFDPVHTAQLMTYLKLSGCKVGLLMNFNVIVLTDGIKRVSV